MAGLELHPVYRLRQLRNSIDGRHKRWFTQLRSWTSSKHNFSEYRHEFSNALLQRQSCVPHLAVHLRGTHACLTPSGIGLTLHVFDMQTW